MSARVPDNSRKMEIYVNGKDRFGIDYTYQLNGDTLSVSTWSVPANVTGTNETKSGQVVAITLTSSVAGTYTISNTCTTVGGFTMGDWIELTVKAMGT